MSTDKIKKVYLKNGQEADLIKEIDGKYLVDPYMVYNGYERNEFTEPCGKLEIVDNIFSEPPIESINKEYLEILEKITTKSGELKKIAEEIQKESTTIRGLKSAHQELAKWMVDLSKYKNAKRLMLFKANEIEPIIIDDKSRYNDKRGAILKFYVYSHDGTTREQCIGLDHEGREEYSNNNNIDQEFGIKIDPTDEEIISLTLERNSKLDASKFYAYLINNCAAKYLSPNFIQRLQQIKEMEKINLKKSTEEEIKKLQEKLKNI